MKSCLPATKEDSLAWSVLLAFGLKLQGVSFLSAFLTGKSRGLLLLIGVAYPLCGGGGEELDWALPNEVFTASCNACQEGLLLQLHKV